ncbi:hypothetical protein L207DRAFT_303397 [Hyaloscypha variabilis F]|uniref:Uncharacterized protein n=1 Tax=Hyaloscypha variabilis (strain UAMH 11265 / GT02V1 / F) TaxID=1149755 RepID=A0A2J6RZ18_HYAVF|nr:hypothetical protein L207DRAFT_303397 [Hyaloscypha variabilis F]
MLLRLRSFYVDQLYLFALDKFICGYEDRRRFAVCLIAQSMPGLSCLVLSCLLRPTVLLVNQDRMLNFDTSPAITMEPYLTASQDQRKSKHPDMCIGRSRNKVNTFHCSSILSNLHIQPPPYWLEHEHY